MGTDEIFEKTRRHIGEYLEQDVDHLRPESKLETAAPGLDSLKIFEMMLYLEECFAIEMEENTLEHVETMEDLVRTIEGKLAPESVRG